MKRYTPVAIVFGLVLVFTTFKTQTLHAGIPCKDGSNAHCDDCCPKGPAVEDLPKPTSIHKGFGDGNNCQKIKEVQYCRAHLARELRKAKGSLKTKRAESRKQRVTSGKRATNYRNSRQGVTGYFGPLTRATAKGFVSSERRLTRDAEKIIRLQNRIAALKKRLIVKIGNLLENENVALTESHFNLVWTELGLNGAAKSEKHTKDDIFGSHIIPEN